MNKLSIFAAVLFATANRLPAPVVEASPQAADEKKMTVIDYYLLLPEKTFEAPPRSWLQNATVIDKQNGYMSVTGDGAQPNFEVALFRYRNGRPLLAICQAELKGGDRVGLSFFKLGSNGKMREASRTIFPIGDQWSSGDYEKRYEDFRFELPRHGRTVVVRSAKTKKVLYRVTWNGEKFVQEK
jgi:hypothetical protein